VSRGDGRCKRRETVRRKKYEWKCKAVRNRGEISYKKTARERSEAQAKNKMPTELNYNITTIIR